MNQYSNYLLRKIIILILVYLGFVLLEAEQAHIWVDGYWEDWASQPSVYEDAAADQAWGNTDFHTLKLAHDERFFYIYIEVNAEILLQENNQIMLYLDTDNNPQTGASFNGVGAEIRWDFGNRSGRSYLNGNNQAIGHEDLGVTLGPSVSSPIFELAFDRTAQIDGMSIWGDEVAIVFRDGNGRDWLPDDGDHVQYTFTETALPPLPSLSLARSDSTHFRLLHYNVHQDDLFENSLQAQFSRIFAAVKPDIIAFQEIYDHSALQTLAWVAPMMSESVGAWHAQKVWPDIIVLSRYPIENVESIDGNGAFLLDLEEANGRKLLLINVHFPASDNNAARQAEIDNVMRYIREFKAEPAHANIPFMITGDMNLVGDAQQLETLLTGDIQDEAQFGPDFAPDWDDSDLTDGIARQPDFSQCFTWYSPTSSYMPSRLDYCIYSDHVMKATNELVLFTQEMQADSLTAYDLQAMDSAASDHLPVIHDFWDLLATTPAEPSVPQSLLKRQTIEAFPNPFNPEVTLRFHVQQKDAFSLTIYNARGQKVKTLLRQELASGTHQWLWDGADSCGSSVSSGVYFVRLASASQQQTKKIVLMK